ncbi:hypothetical protein E2542_SST25044 [Spatholobus suberectus]|nr:hypothetical protein E2542_SST25044 [Spatholobus suberectus]
MEVLSAMLFDGVFQICWRCWWLISTLDINILLTPKLLMELSRTTLHMKLHGGNQTKTPSPVGGMSRDNEDIRIEDLVPRLANNMLARL